MGRLALAWQIIKVAAEAKKFLPEVLQLLQALVQLGHAAKAAKANPSGARWQVVGEALVKTADQANDLLQAAPGIERMAKKIQRAL